MAINLESIFYVFAETKLDHMDKNEFENIIADFALEFEGLKQLARELRNVLFPIRDGAIFAGTVRDNDKNVWWDDRGIQQGNWPSWKRGLDISVMKRMVGYKRFGENCTI